MIDNKKEVQYFCKKFHLNTDERDYEFFIKLKQTLFIDNKNKVLTN